MGLTPYLPRSSNDDKRAPRGRDGLQYAVAPPCDVEVCKRRDTNRIQCAEGEARSPGLGSSSYGLSGILPRVAWCIRCLMPLLSQPSAALLSQKGTHAVRPPFTGDPRPNDNFPF